MRSHYSIRCSELSLPVSIRPKLQACAHRESLGRANGFDTGQCSRFEVDEGFLRPLDEYDDDQCRFGRYVQEGQTLSLIHI